MSDDPHVQKLKNPKHLKKKSEVEKMKELPSYKKIRDFFKNLDVQNRSHSHDRLPIHQKKLNHKLTKKAHKKKTKGNNDIKNNTGTTKMDKATSKRVPHL